MSQIQGALVGIAMVLSAVFIPMAFFGGSTGQFIASSLSLLFQQWRFQYWLR